MKKDKIGVTISMDYTKTIVSNFNNFNGKNLEILDVFYSQDVHFIDPVKNIKGLDDLKSYYRHVYKNVRSIRFDFSNFIENEKSVVGEWKMKLTARGLNGGAEFEVPGCSVFKFNSKGLVTEHRDYVDLGKMVYEKIPVLGLLISTIKKKL